MLDKKNIFRKQGLLPLVGLIAAGSYVFFASYERFLKSKLEESLSRAYGARIDIQTLSAHPFKGTAVLKKIQITNPVSPLKNIFEIDRISLRYSFSEILKKKLVISSIEVEGVHPVTQRVDSGEIEYGSSEDQPQPVVWEKTNSGAYANLRNQIKQGPLKFLSQITTGAYTPTKLPNLNKTLSSLTYLEELNHSLEKANREWSALNTSIPSSAKLNQWQKEVATWQNSSRDIASTEEFQNRRKLAVTIRENHESVNQKLKEAAKLMRQFKTQMDGLSRLLDEDVEKLKKELSLPTANEQDLSLSLFGLRFVTFLEKFSFWSGAYRDSGTVDFGKPGYERVKFTSKNRTYYQFLNSHSHPPFYIEKLTVKQGSEKQNNKNFISAEVTDFTFFPNFYHKNPTVKLQASIPEFELEGVNAELSFGTENGVPAEKLNLSISAFPIDDLVIRSTSDFEIKISHATGTLKIQTVAEGNKLDSSGHFESSGTRFRVSSQFQPFEDILESLTKYRTTLLVQARAHKEDEEINMTVDSEFGKQLSASINSTFQKQLGEIDDTLKAHILDTLFPLRQTVNEKLQDADNIILANMRSTLNEIELIMGSSKKYDPEWKKYQETLTSENIVHRKS